MQLCSNGHRGVGLILVVIVAGGLGCSGILGLEPWSDPSLGAGEGGAGTSAGGDAGSGGMPGTGTTTGAGNVGTGGQSEGGPTCADGVRNGLETDIDCGGDSCAPCALGEDCLNDADCESAACRDGVCGRPPPEPVCVVGEAPTCGDCIKNAAETDVDCGGDACLPCGAAETCLWGADCMSGACGNGVCAAGPSGAACKADNDCASAQCAAGECFTGLCCE